MCSCRDNMSDGIQSTRRNTDEVRPEEDEGENIWKAVETKWKGLLVFNNQ